MKIALDYDLTYTLDPPFWESFFEQVWAAGHIVKIVTARSKELDNIDDRVPPHFDIIYCDGVAKKFACHHYHNFDPDIWIDDKPEAVHNNSTATKEILAEWRATRDH